MTTKRVLICGFNKDKGGMESYVMELYRHFDRDKLQFDFLNFHMEEIAYADEIKRLGGNIYYVPMKRDDYKGHYEALDRVFTENNYVGVYYQCMHKLASLDVFKYAKKYGVPKRVMHAHTTKSPKASIVQRVRECGTEIMLDSYVTDFFACSEEAGKWLYGNRKFEVIKNSINTMIFCYDKGKREQIRRELGIRDELLIGTVGRVTPVKNPEFMLDMFKELHDRNEETAFLHVGDGVLMEKMIEKRAEYQLDEVYHLVGAKENVSDYLNAIDIFVLPSLREGFPISLIEAQATGLPCIVAEHITPKCDLTGRISFLPIDKGTSCWCDAIENVSTSNRKSQTAVIEQKGYDALTVSKQIERFFVEV